MHKGKQSVVEQMPGSVFDISSERFSDDRRWIRPLDWDPREQLPVRILGKKDQLPDSV